MQNAQLLEYIRQERSRGMTPEHIHGNLKNAGWNPADIDQAFAVLGLASTPAPVPAPAPVVTPAPAAAPTVAASPVASAMPASTPMTPATPAQPTAPQQPIAGVPVKPVAPVTPVVQPVQAAPSAPLQQVQPQMTATSDVKYAGFWIRVVAALVDGFILTLVNIVLGFFIGGLDGISKFIILLVIGWLYYVLTTEIYSATLGKRMVGIKVVNVHTNESLSMGRIIIRETIGKIVSGILLLIGFIMVAFTSKKQGLHDFMVGSAVIYRPEFASGEHKMHAGLIIAIIVAFLLPIIAIMGIMSSVVLVSLNTARTKGNDAATKSYITNLRASAELYYTQNNTYSNALDCSSGMFADPNIQTVLSNIKTDKTCVAATTSYAISAKTSDGEYCIDNTGVAGNGHAMASDGKAACSMQ